MKHTLTVSIVVPVYNDANALDDCLRSIAVQSSIPEEVIVVDNNSTDESVMVARQYPFVTILSEKRQGVVHARNRGFNAARGDIIGRLDADTIIAPDWVSLVRNIFQNPDIDAVSGSVQYHHVPYRRFFSYLDMAVRNYMAWSLGREYALQGANLALRRAAWQKSRSRMCHQRNMHEDFDLSIHLREMGHKTVFAEELRASVVFRQAAASWRQFASYILLSPKTYAIHRRWRRVVMYPVVVFAIVLYPVLHVLYLGYDERLDRFSWQKLFLAGTAARVNPATFVD